MSRSEIVLEIKFPLSCRYRDRLEMQNINRYQMWLTRNDLGIGGVSDLALQNKVLTVDHPENLLYLVSPQLELVFDKGWVGVI